MKFDLGKRTEVNMKGVKLITTAIIMFDNAPDIRILSYTETYKYLAFNEPKTIENIFLRRKFNKDHNLYMISI